MKKVMAMIITICIVILNNSVLTFGSTSSSNEKVFDTTKISCTELHGIDIDRYKYIKTPDGKYAVDQEGYSFADVFMEAIY